MIFTLCFFWHIGEWLLIVLEDSRQSEVEWLVARFADCVEPPLEPKRTAPCWAVYGR